MIKAVFFDVGGTLIRPNPSVGDIYSQTAAKHGVSIAAEEMEKRFRAAWDAQKFNRLKIDKAWWKQVVTAAFEGYPFDNFEKFFEDLYAVFESKDAWFVYPDVVPTLAELKRRHLKLAVLSNWDDRLPALLRVLELDRYFDGEFVSYQMGLIKPNPDMFRQALESLGVHPLEAIHIGDDPSEDIKGAEAAGMRAYLIDRHSRPTSSRMMSSLEEVFTRLT